MKGIAVLRMVLLLPVVIATSLAHAGPTVCFEAESATTLVALMQIGNAATASTNKTWSAVTGASGDSYIEIPQASVTKNVGKPTDTHKTPLPGSATFEFRVSAGGMHQLWCRVWWLDACGNSANISLDGARPFSFGQDRTFKAWHWVRAPKRLKQLDLSEGKHSMVISAREDGIRIDQILLTDDEDFVPVGIEDVTDDQEPKEAKSNGT